LIVFFITLSLSRFSPSAFFGGLWQKCQNKKVRSMKLRTKKRITPLLPHNLFPELFDM